MAASPEVQALMHMDSGSESDTTEFLPMDKTGHHPARNGNTVRPHERRKNAQCLSTVSLALILSGCINIVLLIVLITSGGKRGPPTDSAQTQASSDSGQSVPLTGHNNSDIVTPFLQSLSPTSPSTTTQPSPTSKQTSGLPLPVTRPVDVTCLTSTVTCGTEQEKPHRDDSYVNVFRDLSRGEINAVLSYLQRQREFRLSGSHNYVFGIELYVPSKASVLGFLDSPGPQPPREALVSLALVAETPPVFRQYVVGPLPVPTSHRPNPRMTKTVPASRLTGYGSSEAYSFVLGQMQRRDVQTLLSESFGATTTECSAGSVRCLMLLSQKISFGLVNTTSFTYTAYYRVEFPIIHPVPFQLVVGETTPGVYTVRSVYYAGASFSSLSDLVTRYQAGTVLKVTRTFPGVAPGQGSVAGSLNLRGAAFPKTPHPPPRQYQPKGARYSVVNQHVRYLEWSFNVRNSVESGPQLFDIKWAGERIVYELSLQEIAVLYAGANPSAMFAHLSDSAFGLGDNDRRLVPGVDCPDHATFVSMWIYTANTGSTATQLPNVFCVFEHNSGIPLRRHSFNGFRRERKFNGLVDSYLVVRGIIVEYNYDYIVDFVFHNNGALETRVYATGYIMSQWFHYGEDAFGFRVHDDVVGSVHHHLFNFKVDLDVGGLANRYETLDFGVDDRDWQWLSTLKPSATASSTSPSGRGFQQITYKHHVKKTEREALYHYNFDQPKYHLFYTDQNKNDFDNPRAYRVETRGFSKQVLPVGHPALRSRKWANHCMAVTERKEEESKSSSIFSMYDADDPVVDFDTFLEDDGSIVDKDLVAWITVGMHHIPHTEDVPNTPTVGTEASILLTPYNYFHEDPSVRSRDAVSAERRDGVTYFQTYGTETEFTCLPMQYGWLKRSDSVSYP